MIISLCVAIILFEGGLTLNAEGIKKTPKVIWRLLTLGVLITWFGTTGLIYFILDYSFSLSLLAGSLIIVTGPTVIAPLLKRIQIKGKLFNILHWEGVLIDPIGVFIAILCFEWLSIEGNFFKHIEQLSYRLMIGTLFGYVGGKLITLLLKKELIPKEQINIFVFGSAIFLYFVSDYVSHESGILTVVIAGFVLGWTNPPRLKHIQKFKSELTELAIALVFILLAANLELRHFLEMGWSVIIVLAGVLFLVRPLSIMLCGYRTTLSFREKVFLSWIAPRGVIAGSMASLFGLKLTTLGHSNAIFLETFTFSVILSTIILQGGSARKILLWLKLEEPEKRGWLIIGAHLFSRKVAQFIERISKGSCVFLDTNSDAIQEAKQAGLVAFQGNALSLKPLPKEITDSIGYVLALTDNRDLNQLICEKWSEAIENRKLFRWTSQNNEVEQQIAGKGIPIWPTLPKPSQVSYDLKTKEKTLHQMDNLTSKTVERTSLILMTESQEEISFNRPADISTATKFLVLQRVSGLLTGLLRKQHVMFIQPDSYQEAIETVIKRMAEIYPELANRHILSELLTRELAFPTTLAHGVAAPHLHCSALTEPICFLAHISKEIDLRTYEGEPVKLLFVLLSQESEPDLHLRILAEIASATSTPEKVQTLLNAKTAAELSQLMAEGR